MVVFSFIDTIAALSPLRKLGASQKASVSILWYVVRNPFYRETEKLKIYVPVAGMEANSTQPL